ncbi:hypothetical protein ACHAO9_008017 [Fusarium lateritium]
MRSQELTQVHVKANGNEYVPVTHDTIDIIGFSREEAHLQETLLSLCPANLWHNGSYAAGCPRPVLVGRHHQQQLQDLHDALTAAITNIVQRWWSDTNARFPQRMPLEPEEEELLQILQGLFSLFQPDRPLHLLKGAEKGIDIHMFIDAVWRRFAIKPRLITPAQLRLYPDTRSKSGYRLCCVVKGHDNLPNSWKFAAKDGEVWEEIHQVGLELHQRELIALDPEILRQISLRCFNDMRTVLLVHDKRMLGIVRQELTDLVNRGVLSKMQAEALDSGIVQTILPGSNELHALIRETIATPDLRHDYILKPIRSGKGDGIVFGEDLTGAEWTARLQTLVSANVIPGVSCVVQRRIVPREYDLVLHASAGMVRHPLVGTYLVVNGKLLGLGTWRASGGRIVAVSSGGSWICSVMENEDKRFDE